MPDNATSTVESGKHLESYWLPGRITIPVFREQETLARLLREFDVLSLF